MTKKLVVKKSNLAKVASFACAGMLAVTMLPLGQIASSAQILGAGVGTETILVPNAPTQANKGEKYNIRVAYFGDAAKIPVGLDSYAGYAAISDGLGSENSGHLTVESSSVTVTYKPSGETFTVDDEKGKLTKTLADSAAAEIDDEKNAVWGTMQMDYAGEYGINYSITIKYSNNVTRTFTTELSVISQNASASFEFAENDSTILPSHYDVKLLEAKGKEDKNLYLPLPKVFDKSERDVTEETSFVTEKPAEDEGDYVLVSAVNSEGTVAVQKNSANKFYIEADDLKTQGQYTILYEYYSNGQFVSSIKKEVTVEDGYYADSKTGTPTYDNYGIDLNLNGNMPTSAITKVELDPALPSISGVTKATTNPSKEAVEIYYTIEARRCDIGSEKWSDASEEDIKDVTDGFTPWADGDYRITYKAKNFYSKDDDDVATLTRQIYKVKDTQKPTAVMYDAGDENNYADFATKKLKENGLTEVKTKLKTISGEGNIIIYAAGGNDNVADSNNLECSIEVDGYNDFDIPSIFSKYNLIFDFTSEKELFNSNYALQQAIKATAGYNDVTAESTEQIKTWLKEHNYAIYKNSKNDTDNNKVELKEDNGYNYAYFPIDYAPNGIVFVGADYDRGNSYTITYIASDGINSPDEKEYNLHVKKDFHDTEAPTITLPAMKASYRKGSVIEFSAPDISDDDTDLDILAEYYYVENGETNIGGAKFENDEYKIDLSRFTEVVEESKVPSHVVIKVTATDDYGNTGTVEKKIEIVDFVDEVMPTIIREEYKTPLDKVEHNQTVELPSITLHDNNVEFINASVTVTRYTYDNEGKVKEETPITVYGTTSRRDKVFNTFTLNSGSIIASYAGTYKVNIKFIDGGNNQLSSYYEFTVTAAPVEQEPVLIDPATRLGNEGKAEVGEQVQLPAPKVAYKIDEEHYSVFGVEEDGKVDENHYEYDFAYGKEPKTKYYRNRYESGTFESAQPDDYEFVCNANVTVYNKTKFAPNSNGTLLVESGTSNIVVQELIENEGIRQSGNLIIFTDPASAEATPTVKYAVKGADGYKVYTLSGTLTFQKATSGAYLYVEEGGEQYQLITNGSLGFVSAKGDKKATISVENDQLEISFNGAQAKTFTSNETLALTDFQTYYLQSNILTLSTSDTTAPQLAKYSYPPQLAYDKDTTVLEIYNIQATDNSYDGIDKNKSYIEVRRAKFDDTSDTVKTYYLYEHSESIIKLTGSDVGQGVYTITYHVVDCYGNEAPIVEGVTRYTISVGDAEPPKIEVDLGLKASYTLEEVENTPIRFNVKQLFDNGKLVLSDDKDTAENLYKNLTIKIVDDNDSEHIIENSATEADKAEGWYEFKIDKVGTYKIVFETTDTATWKGKKEIPIEVTVKAEEGVEVTKVVGIVLIVVAALVLVGVIAYFVITKILRDKKKKSGKDGEKSKAKAKKSDKK